MPSPTTTTTTTSTDPLSTTPSDATSLETDLLAHLASTPALDDIHTNLLCYLQRMGWTEKIRTLSFELLRAGRCERFDEVVDAVIASAECRKHPAFEKPKNGNGTGAGANGNNANGAGGSNGNGGGSTNGGKNGMLLNADAEAYLENVDVRIPAVVVEHGVRMVKDVLKDVVVFEDGAPLDEGLDGSHHGSSTGSANGHNNGKAGKRLEKDDSGDSSGKGKNGDTSSPVKKTGKKMNPTKNGK